MKTSWIPFKSGFDQFEQYVIDHLGLPPTPAHVINRIDINKGIKPGNLQWATRQVVGNHRSNNMMICIDREKKSLADWSRQVGIPAATIWSRIRVYGYTPQEAIKL